MGSLCTDKSLDVVSNKHECRMAVSDVQSIQNKMGSNAEVNTKITTRKTCESPDLPKGCIFLQNDVFWNHDQDGGTNLEAQQVCKIRKKTVNEK